MPPAISDSEDETFENMVQVSSQKNKKNGNKAEDSADVEEVLNVESADEREDEDDDDEDKGDEADVYTVEKILTHQFNDDGKILFQIKWEGYEKLADRTWEPEENLETAADMVEEYFESLGGREKVLTSNKTGKKAESKKRGRQSNVGASASIKKAKTTRKSVTRSVTPEEPAFQPPSGSWEDEVKAIDAAEGAQGQVQVYLTWRDGHKTQHPLDVCYKRCPQKMLKFYESHLSFVSQKKADGKKTNGTPASSKSHLQKNKSSTEDD